MRDTIKMLAAFFTALAFSSHALAHEYYLLPETFKPETGVAFAVDHRLGQDFKGSTHPWITRWNVRSEVWTKGEKADLVGKDGDRPALTVPPQPKGLAVVVHQSNISTLDFREREKFEAYLNKEGLSAIIAAHAESGLAQPSAATPVREAYARFAKTIVNVGGDRAGQDVATGLTVELVAGENPLALEAGQPMPVTLLWRGKPLEGATVKVFPRPGEPFVHRIVTDAQGRAMIPDDGPGPYLLNAIHMERAVSPEAVEKKAIWESWWASLTFSRAR